VGRVKHQRLLEDYFDFALSTVSSYLDGRADGLYLASKKAYYKKARVLAQRAEVLGKSGEAMLKGVVVEWKKQLEDLVKEEDLSGDKDMRIQIWMSRSCHRLRDLIEDLRGRDGHENHAV